MNMKKITRCFIKLYGVKKLSYEFQRNVSSPYNYTGCLVVIRKTETEMKVYLRDTATVSKRNTDELHFEFSSQVNFSSMINQGLYLNNLQREFFSLLFLINNSDFRNYIKITEFFLEDLLDTNIHFLDSSNDSCINANKVAEWLYENVQDNIRVEDICSVFHVSKSVLEKRFSEKFGIGVIAYYKSLKIKKAQQLLKNSNLQIREISHQLGFCNASQFAQVFKKHTGTSPKEFRRLK
jgi:AraC-like DNA-binding protein